jgi:soluble lytic murein transglycosylase-like protein
MAPVLLRLRVMMVLCLRAFTALAFATLLVGPASAAEPGAMPTEATAQIALAQRYEHAEGLPRDFDKALALYCAAARQGSAVAALDIGWMFLNGRGVARNDATGAAWLRLAAERGEGHAAQLLQRLRVAAAVTPTGCPAPERRLIAPVPPAQIAKIVAETAPRLRVDPKLVLAVIAAESAFQSDAVSPKNAQGLMQLMPETAARFGVKDVFDPRENIKGGTRYLQWLIAHFEGDLTLALAGYNAGENAVTRYGGVPPYPETQAYVEKVSRLYGANRHRVERDIHG